MLQACIENCGGISNIARVLVYQDQLIFEVKSADLIADHQRKHHFNSALSQITVNRDHSVADAQLAALGVLIEQEQLKALANIDVKNGDTFRPNWHIAPPSGLLNDPNGFILHDGQYHLFYQWNPFACEHKDKYWAHMTSKNLVDWDFQPVALTPSDWFDSHGVFSGHAISHNDQLIAFYTGNVRVGEQRDRLTTQCMAVSHDGIRFEKQGPVVPGLPEGVTPHCRDPKVIKLGEKWLMLLGVQTEELKGRLAVYQSDDLRNWQFDKLYGEELSEFGYMWECPDLFELDGQKFVVICPQGVKPDSVYHTVEHSNGYLRAELSPEGELQLSDFQILDHGFDFYAPQTLETEDGRRVLSAWMGLPDEVNHPSVDCGWIHQITCLRELCLRDGKIIQQPVRELQSLRGGAVSFNLNNSSYLAENNSYELEAELEWGTTLKLFKGSDQEVIISLNSGLLKLDRSHTLIREGDRVRELALQSDKVKLHILADTSSLEIFINGGEYVMSSRVFVEPDACAISLDGNADFTLWPLNPASITSAQNSIELIKEGL